MNCVDGFLTKEQFSNIANHFLGNSFAWFYNESSYSEKRQPTIGNYVDYPQLVHCILLDGKVLSPIEFDILHPLLQKLNPKEIFRIKCNMSFRSDDSGISSYGYPHVDFIDGKELNLTTAVFYLNEADGDTILFNERVGTPLESYTISQKIEPKPNRLLLFPSYVTHAGNSPKKYDRRVVININYR